MGCLIHFFEMPPFLVTLAGLFCLRGLGFVIHPESIGTREGKDLLRNFLAGVAA